MSGQAAVSGPVEGRLGLVVVNFGSAHLIEANLGAVDLDGLPVHVVVVDNFSSEAERRAVETLTASRGWDAVLLPDNRGFGGGVNAGVARARAAGCTTLCFLNPDAHVEPAVIEELRRESLRSPGAMISPRVLGPDGADWFTGAVVHLDSGRIRGSGSADARGSRAGLQEWLTGACLVVHADLWERLGGFDESYFLYWEDVDLSRRCLEAGGRLVVRRDLVARHDVGGTQGRPGGRAKSALYYRYNCRNRLLFAARHLSRRGMLGWVRHTPAVSREILLRGGRRQLLGHPGLVLAAVRGTVEGMRLVLVALVRRRPVPPGEQSVLVVHPGAELYGSDRMLAESVAGIVDGGRAVTVAVPGPGPLVPLLRERGAQVVFCAMPILRKSSLTARGVLGLVGELLRGVVPAARLIRRHGSAGVYVSTQVIPLWAPLARLLGRRVTTHVHEAEGSAPRWLRLLLALPVIVSDRVVFNSEYSRDVLLDSLPPAPAGWAARRSSVVYNGVAGPAVAVAARPAVHDGLRLLYVGRLSPRKGPHVAVEALDLLRRRGVEARLTLAGSVFPGYEWYEAELREEVRRRDLGDRVELLGFVPDVWGPLAAADVVLIPSVQDEPFGNTAVEAVLAARPVVVSATSGLLEASRGLPSAQAVPPGDACRLADAVERVRGDWAEFAHAARSDAETAGRRYDVARYRRTIAEIVAGRGAREERS